MKRPVSMQTQFSLLELLVAIAVLAMALSTTLLMISQSQHELIRARQQWLDQHAMTQAGEYYLLANPKDLSMPEGIVPEGYMATCELRRIDDELPEFAQPARQGWLLVAYDMSLIRDNGDFVDQMTVYKLVREEDL